MSTFIPDGELFKHAERVKGRVVLITGAANGIGKEAAIRFASHGAKIVIGDRDEVNGRKVVSEIEDLGGSATFSRIDVTNWDDQVELFDHAIATYNSVDVVVANAGVGEGSHITALEFKDGKPLAPSLLTLDVNISGSVYTATLALHYLTIGQKEGDLKALVFIGSMASWVRAPHAELYTTSKHAVLGLMRALHETGDRLGIRVGCIHPFFADTDILPIPAKLFLVGIPFTTTARIAGAIFRAATDPDPSTSAASWMLPDNGPVFFLPKEELRLGVYEMIDNRVNAMTSGVRGIVFYSQLVSDLWQIARPLQKYAFAGSALAFAWNQRVQLQALFSNIGLGQ
ncbi:NAD(P)-binding protein [Coprinopsis marcescibilis]|uniref:NAD(P)-binding protein n=1 Tax=Coprinopsis marcescibilis TaxID=230819 RepID=A0A5C3KXI1_COPMA|nr:NAD(P)-binding protein [Coprinopsis marcescibilis]